MTLIVSIPWPLLITYSSSGCFTLFYKVSSALWYWAFETCERIQRDNSGTSRIRKPVFCDSQIEWIPWLILVLKPGESSLTFYLSLCKIQLPVKTGCIHWALFNSQISWLNSVFLFQLMKIVLFSTPGCLHFADLPKWPLVETINEEMISLSWDCSILQSHT